MDDIKHNRRFKNRSIKDARAQYFLKKYSLRYQDCSIINISPTGAKVKLPRHEKFNQGTEIYLDIYLSAGFKQISVSGMITWFKRSENEIICGVQFAKKLDEDTIINL